MRLLFSDNFDRGTLGAPWTADASVSLLSNQMLIGAPGHLATVADLAADGEFQVTAVAGAGAGGPVSSLVFRFLDPSNFWYVYHYVDGGNLHVRKVIAGSDSAAFVAGSVPGAGTLVYKVTVLGDAVLLEINGTPYINDVMSAPDAALSAAWTGAGCRASSTGCVFDDFSVVVADAAGSDIGTGADSAALAAFAPPMPESGSGADTATAVVNAITLTGAETAVAVDSTLLTALLAVVETGAGSDLGAADIPATGPLIRMVPGFLFSGRL